MAIPEGLTIMPEELNLPEQTPGLSEPPISSVAESTSIKDRVRKYLTPAVAALGMAAGIVYSGNQEPVHAAPVADTDDSSTGDFKPVDTVLLPLVGVNMVDAHRPVAPAVTVEPSPRASATGEPSVTATPGASNTPEIPTATSTATGTPTERPTPTEQGPLKEAQIPNGAKVGFLASASSADAPHYTQGDPVAVKVGLDDTTLSDPVIDGNFVVGTVSVGGDNPETVGIKEDRHSAVVRVPITMVNQVELDSIPQADPETDSRLGHEISLWKVAKEPLKLVLTATGGESFAGGVFNGDFSKGADVHLHGWASGSADAVNVTILSRDEQIKHATVMTMRYDIARRQWAIYNSERNYTQATQNDDSVTDQPDSKELGTEIYRFPAGTADILFRIAGNSITVPDQPGSLLLPYPLKEKLNFVRAERAGTARSSAQFTLQEGSIKFLDADGKAFKESPETQLPSIVQLAEKLKMRAMSPVDSSMLSGQPGYISLNERTGQLADLNQKYQDGESAEKFYLNQDNAAALLLGASDSKDNLLEKINEHPGATFQFAPRGHIDSGFVGSVFNPDGSLVNPSTLRVIAEAAKANGSNIIIKSNLPLDLSGSEIQSTQLSPMQKALLEMQELGKDLPVTITFSGDQRDYRHVQLSPEALSIAVADALKQFRYKNIKTGLTEIIGDNAQWYRTVADALVMSESDVFGFAHLTRRIGDSHPTVVGIFDYRNAVNGPVENNQYYTYSAGEREFREALIEAVMSK